VIRIKRGQNNQSGRQLLGGWGHYRLTPSGGKKREAPRSKKGLSAATFQCLVFDSSPSDRREEKEGGDLGHVLGGSKITKQKKKKRREKDACQNMNKRIVGSVTGSNPSQEAESAQGCRQKNKPPTLPPEQSP